MSSYISQLFNNNLVFMYIIVCIKREKGERGDLTDKRKKDWLTDVHRLQAVTFKKLYPITSVTDSSTSLKINFLNNLVTKTCIMKAAFKFVSQSCLMTHGIKSNNSTRITDNVHILYATYIGSS